MRWWPSTSTTSPPPADSMKTPSHIAPTWYFTPFYSVLRATTADFMYVLMAAVAAYVVFIWFKSRLSFKMKVVVAAIALVVIIGMLTMEAKFWGVVLFGSRLRAGAAAYARGAFFEAHEHFEHAWKASGAPRSRAASA